MDFRRSARFLTGSHCPEARKCTVSQGTAKREASRGSDKAWPVIGKGGREQPSHLSAGKLAFVLYVSCIRPRKIKQHRFAQVRWSFKYVSFVHGLRCAEARSVKLQDCQFQPLEASVAFGHEYGTKRSDCKEQTTRKTKAQLRSSCGPCSPRLCRSKKSPAVLTLHITSSTAL